MLRSVMFALTLIAAASHAQGRPTILVTSGSEAVTSTSTTGGATRVGNTVIGSGGSSTSTYEHSEVWEVVRRFSSDCPGATFVTNPETPHTMTVHTDYEKVGSPLFGQLKLYQLSLLDDAGNPLFVSKKNYLYRQIKPVCKVISERVAVPVKKSETPKRPTEVLVK